MQVGDEQKRLGDESITDGKEGALVGCSPLPGGVLLAQRGKWEGKKGVLWDVLRIVVRHTEELLDFTHRSRGWPICHRGNLRGVRLDAFGRD